MIRDIREHPVYQQVMADSFGGIMYNVANRDKYDPEGVAEILELWYNAGSAKRDAAGGIIRGAINFLEGN